MAGNIRFFFNPELEHNVKVIKAKDGNKDLKLISPRNVANMGDVVAKIVDNNAEPEDGVVKEQNYTSGDFKAGINVSFDRERKLFIAMSYGFTTIINNTICIEPPLLINKHKTRGILLVYPNRMRIWPSLDDIIHICNQEAIVQLEPFEKMRKFLGKLQKGKPRLVKMLVAEGRMPVKGYKGYNKLLIDISKKAGKVREDGSIDFHEQDSVIQISQGQEIAEAIPGIKPENGIDIFGNELKTETLEFTSYNLGKNIKKQGEKFVSEVEGVLILDGRKVSVSEMLIVEGDVDFHQGNIDFTGSVHIKKNVTPGFKVKAEGDVIIDGSVDDAEIYAGGNVTIGKGVTSQTGKTLIEAKGTIKAKYVMEAEITAERDVIIEEYASNATITAYENVIVTTKKGQIMGGETTAKFKIEAINVGSKNEQPTYLYVGKDPVAEEELRQITEQWEEANKKLKEISKDIKNKWDERFFMQPEEYIESLRPEQRAKFAPVAKDYGLYKKQFDDLEENRKELTASLKIEPPPKVVVHNNTYGGVVIHIFTSVRKIDKKYVGTVFKEENKEIGTQPIT